MGGKKKILIIDDEKDFCILVKANLEKSGEYEIITVNTGEEGIARAKESEFDLVITDFLMPGMDGGQVLEILKEMDQDLPVVLFSIYHDDPSRVSPEIRDKADALLGKPIDNDALKEVIKKILK